MLGMDEKKPEDFKLFPGSIPSVERNWVMAAEVIARYVGRSILTTPLEFIEKSFTAWPVLTGPP
jgi:hypothetical protein